MPPTVKPDRTSAWHLYVLSLDLAGLRITRGRFIEELKGRGVMTSVHFIPLYRHPYYRDTFGYRPEEFPVSEHVSERVVSLPIFPGMEELQVAAVIDSAGDVASRYRR